MGRWRNSEIGWNGRTFRALLVLCLGAACCVGAARAEDPVPGGQPAAATSDKPQEPVVGRWVSGLEAGINLTQSSYSSNWSGGERGAVVWTAILNGTLENQMSPTFRLSNALKLAYGQTHQQAAGPAGRFWESPDKSTDLLSFESIGRFTLGGFVDPFVSGLFESQFQGPPDESGISRSLNPLRFKESAGISRQVLKTEDRELLSRFGFGFRQNVRRFTPLGGTQQTEKANDGGLEWVSDYKAKILSDRISWTAKVTLFQPLFYSGKSKFDAVPPADLVAAGIDPHVSDYATALDADWENVLTSQITKLLSVNLYVRWMYDKYDNSVLPSFAAGHLDNAPDVKAAVRKAGQLKETMSIGITYRFL